MAILTTDVHTRASIVAGAAGNSTAPGAAGTSLGKYITNADLTDNVLNNLFPDTTGDENTASSLDYQCMFVYNAHATLTLQNVTIWLNSEVAGGDTMALGADTTAASALGNASAQALTIANKNTAPVGVSFSSPTTKGTGINLGNLPAGQVVAFWVRRTANNTGALANDGGQLGVAGDTAP